MDLKALKRHQEVSALPHLPPHLPILPSLTCSASRETRHGPRAAAKSLYAAAKISRATTKTRCSKEGKRKRHGHTSQGVARATNPSVNCNVQDKHEGCSVLTHVQLVCPTSRTTTTLFIFLLCVPSCPVLEEMNTTHLLCLLCTRHLLESHTDS